MKQADLRDMFKNVSQEHLYSDPLSPFLSPFSSEMMPENTQEDPDDHEPADEEGLHILPSCVFPCSMFVCLVVCLLLLLTCLRMV